MNKKLLELLIRLEVSQLLDKGIDREQAIKQAAEKLRDGAIEAEFETYCAEHNC